MTITMEAIYDMNVLMNSETTWSTSGIRCNNWFQEETPEHEPIGEKSPARLQPMDETEAMHTRSDWRMPSSKSKQRVYRGGSPVTEKPNENLHHPKAK